LTTFYIPAEPTEGHNLQAPFSLDTEDGNALSAMIKRDQLSLNQARQVLAQYGEIPIRRTNLPVTDAQEYL